MRGRLPQTSWFLRTTAGLVVAVSFILAAPMLVSGDDREDIEKLIQHLKERHTYLLGLEQQCYRDARFYAGRVDELQRAVDQTGRMTNEQATMMLFVVNKANEATRCMDKAVADRKEIETALSNPDHLLKARDLTRREIYDDLRRWLTRAEGSLTMGPTTQYNDFTATVKALQRDARAIRNRYILALKRGEAKPLADTMSRVEQALVDSARAWYRELTAKGLSNAIIEKEKESARTQRYKLWDTARQDIEAAK